MCVPAISSTIYSATSTSGSIPQQTATATWCFTLTFQASPANWTIIEKDWMHIAKSASTSSVKSTPTFYHTASENDWTKRTGLSTNWTIWFRSANVPDRKCISSSTNTTTSPTPSFPMRKACTATLMKRMAKVICVLSSIRWRQELIPA